MAEPGDGAADIEDSLIETSTSQNNVDVTSVQELCETIEDFLDNDGSKATVKKYLLELRDIMNEDNNPGDIHQELQTNLEQNIKKIKINDFGEYIGSDTNENIATETHRIKKYYQRKNN